MRALMALALAPTLFAPGSSDATERTVVYAHRGGAALGPENTLGLFRSTHARFPDAWLELDVRLAGDQTLVVMHDATLDRTTTNCKGLVVKVTSRRLAKCDARKGWAWPNFEPVPRLRDVMREGARSGWALLIDLKQSGYSGSSEIAIRDLVRSIDATSYPAARLIIQSFWKGQLRLFQGYRRDILTGLLTGKSGLHDGPAPVEFSLLESVWSAMDFDINAPQYGTLDLTRGTVAALQSTGRTVMVWTVNSLVDIQGAVRLGVDGIVTDRPDLLYRVLQGAL